MSNKTFMHAPKPILGPFDPPPSAEVIAAFESGGPGHDTRNRISTKVVAEAPTIAAPTATPAPASAGKVTKRVEQPEEVMHHLTINLPKGLHRRFKVACAKHDKKMVEEVTSFIEKRTAQLEKE